MSGKMMTAMVAMMSAFGGLGGRWYLRGSGSSAKRKTLDAQYSEAWHGGQLQARNGQPCVCPYSDTHSRNRWMQGYAAIAEGKP